MPSKVSFIFCHYNGLCVRILETQEFVSRMRVRHKMANDPEVLVENLRRLLSHAKVSGAPTKVILLILNDELQRNTTKMLALKKLALRVLSALFIVLVSYGAIQLRNGPYCFVPTLMVIPGMTQPIADCNMCKGVTGAPRLVNLSRRDFILHHAYSTRPVVVLRAALNWSATSLFSYDYFRSLYTTFPGALDSDASNGQFFSYSSNIRDLKDLFELSYERATMHSERWYIGWSTSDPLIAKEIKMHVPLPSFLSPMNQDNTLTWIFMGAPGPGASMHLDDVSEASWQAQLSGTKTWTLAPPLECDSVCKSFTITVHKGDIIVVNTNVWYHQTYIHAGNLSITVGSEFR